MQGILYPPLKQMSVAYANLKRINYPRLVVQRTPLYAFVTSA